MLRPATPDALERLMVAAHDDDHELDTALVRLGVLPPLDLSEIRSWLTLADIEIHATANCDGHRVITVGFGHRTVAAIHHDGHVVASGQGPLLKSA